MRYNEGNSPHPRKKDLIMEDITEEVVETLASASNHRTATLATALGLVITTAAIYGTGKLVGRRRARKEAAALPEVVKTNIEYIEAQAN
jgi:hypothetical protein